MLDTMPDTVLKSISSLKNDARFEGFLKYVNEQSLSLAIKSTVLKDDTISRWHQGASQGLYELIEQITESRETLEKIEKLGHPRR